MTLSGLKTNMTDSSVTSAFKAYDVRGIYPVEINESLAFSIGQAYANLFKPKNVVVGRDVRISSESLSKALIEGLISCSVDVIDIGLCGTEQVYFAVPFLNAQGGIMITASHNPKDYNGMKFVCEGSIPISGDSGLIEMKRMITEGRLKSSGLKGCISYLNIDTNYIRHLLSFFDTSTLKNMRLLVNAGNGMAGKIVDLLEPNLPFEFIKINHEPDGNFPKGVPNPLLLENRDETSKALINSSSNIAIAWDGDFDRCFFFDEKGRFIEGYYIVGLLAGELIKNKGQKIIIDTRLIWNTQDIVTKLGGIIIVSKTGHAFIKERMRQENALYGGEMSGHHYFRDFFYCDSGMIPWLLITNIMSKYQKNLSQLIDEMVNNYPCSGEINVKANNHEKILNTLKNYYQKDSLCIDYIDGLSMEFKDWRFNMRSSNTEALFRLNIESRANQRLIEEKVKEIMFVINSIQLSNESINNLC